MRAVARESPLVVLVSMLVLFWAFVAPELIKSDSWLTFLGGREIAAHGIPRHDTLAVMTHGLPWIDEQWLGQLAFWGVFRLGGIGLAVVVTIALLALPVVIAVAVARRRGASATSILPFVFFCVIGMTSFLRAQVFSQALFVVVLALLASESRRKTWRVALVFPVLAVWANVHGAVVVGAALTSLLGACELVPARRVAAFARAAALIVVPWACVLATPYGLSIVDYYRATMSNPVFREFEAEWVPPVFTSIVGAFFFLVAAAALVLVTRRGRDLTAFELGALAVTLAGALTAVRSVPWFDYSAIVLLPPLFERCWRRTPTAAPAFALPRVFLAGITAAAAVAACAAVAFDSSRVLRPWSPQVQPVVASVLREDPHARVFAGHEVGDWLLFTVPEARGRIAFDGRFELLPDGRLRAVVHDLGEEGDSWERPSLGYRLLVLSRVTNAKLIATYRRRGVHQLVRTPDFVVFDRGRAR